MATLYIFSLTEPQFVQGSRGSVAVLTYTTFAEEVIVSGDVMTEDGEVYAIESCSEGSENRASR